MKNTMEVFLSFKMIKYVCASVVVLFFALASISRVSRGTVGVVQHFGAVDAVPLEPGIHLTRPWPFTDVVEEPTSIVMTEGEAHAASHDLQVVTTKVAVQWAVVSKFAPQILQNFGVGQLDITVMQPAIQEVVKAVSAQYTAEELITKRNEVKTAIVVQLEAFVKQTLSGKNLVGAIKIANVAVTDFQFSKEFNDSIESKVKAEQDSLRAKNEMNTRVTQAEAKASEVTLAAEAAAKSTKLAADATAYQTDAESKARAAAITREANALQSNPGLVQLRIAERWDGKLPTYTGNSIPLLQLK